MSLAVAEAPMRYGLFRQKPKLGDWLILTAILGLLERHLTARGVTQ